MQEVHQQQESTKHHSTAEVIVKKGPTLECDTHFADTEVSQFVLPINLPASNTRNLPGIQLKEV